MEKEFPDYIVKVSNINVQLGTQAQSAQNALNTSNALAQQLLAQQQANSQLRGEYMNVIGNQYSKVKNAQATNRQMADSAYNNSYERWNKNFTEKFGDNPFAQASSNHPDTYDNLTKKTSENNTSYTY